MTTPDDTKQTVHSAQRPVHQEQPAPAPERPSATAADSTASGAQVRDLGALVGDGLAGIVGMAADAHHAVGLVVEATLPAPGSSIAAASGAIASGVYGSVRVLSRWAPVAVAEVVARTPAASTPVAASRLGGALHPVVNGFWGDRIARERPSLAIPMAVRVAGADLTVTPEAVAAAFPAATGHLVVFVHGLVETDQAWWPSAEEPSEALSFGDRLVDDVGATPVYLRFNTGSRVSENGEALAALLQQLTEVWPQPVERISLVGHSMGGLVAVSACRAAAEADLSWVELVDAVVTLGSPHLGAPLEKAVHAATWLLRRTALTEPYSRPIGVRSVGIKDLRHGAITQADWADDELLVPDGFAPAALLPHITYCHLAATITADPEHPIGRLVGDGLVRYPSASGQGWVRRIPFDPAAGARLGGVGHLALLHHPDVYEYLRGWLDPEAGQSNVP